MLCGWRSVLNAGKVTDVCANHILLLLELLELKDKVQNLNLLGHPRQMSSLATVPSNDGRKGSSPSNPPKGQQVGSKPSHWDSILPGPSSGASFLAGVIPNPC